MIHENVFLHIFTDAGQINLGFDNDLGEYFGITDARNFKNLKINKPPLIYL